MSGLNPFLLAANTPEPDVRLLPLLHSQPELASRQDNHGYSLLHAAASYNHVGLLRTLVQEFHVDVNLRDEDGETCLFVAETLEVVRCLIHELHVDVKAKNDEDMTAAEKMETEGDFPDLARYLQLLATKRSGDEAESGLSAASGVTGHPPPLPPNMNVSISTMSEQEQGLADQEPDPEFRRRIEELAARENFNTQEGQQELRDLIADAVRGGVNSSDRDVRRRLDS